MNVSPLLATRKLGKRYGVNRVRLLQHGSRGIQYWHVAADLPSSAYLNDRLRELSVLAAEQQAAVGSLKVSRAKTKCRRQGERFSL